MVHLHQATQGQVLALDGKTVYGSFDSATGSKALHLASAFACEARLVLGREEAASVGQEDTSRVRKEQTPRTWHYCAAWQPILCGRTPPITSACHSSGKPRLGTPTFCCKNSSGPILQAQTPNAIALLLSYDYVVLLTGVLHLQLKYPVACCGDLISYSVPHLCAPAKEIVAQCLSKSVAKHLKNPSVLISFWEFRFSLF